MLKNIACAIITLYQFLFSEDRFFYRRKSCNFYPSCSEYAKEAISAHGVLEGTYLSIIRILKCNPRSGFLIDCVPKHIHD